MIGWVPNLFSLVTAYNLPARNAAVDTGHALPSATSIQNPTQTPTCRRPMARAISIQPKPKAKHGRGKPPGPTMIFWTRNTHCRQKPSTCATVRCTVITVENV